MRTTTILPLLLLLAALPLGCTAPVGSSNAGSSKSDARAGAGKADGEDPCAENEWYGDGECDLFCPEADPDCGREGHPACGGPSLWTCDEPAICFDGDGDDCAGPDCLGLCIDAPPCESDDDCDASSRCISDPDPACATTTGHCYIQPLSCAPAEPVCGCDGRTYASACSARSNLVPVAFAGECEEGT